MASEETFDTSLIQDLQAESPTEVQPVVEPLDCLSNWDAYAEYEAHSEVLATTYGGLGAAFVTLFSVSLPVLGSLAAAPLVIPMGFVLRRVQKLHQLMRVLKPLLEAFEEDGMEALTELQVPGFQYTALDLFVRFPSKNFFAIALRSQGKTKITYNEEKQAFVVRKLDNGKGLRPWKPDHLEQLRQQEYWLRKNHAETLFGKGAKDRRKPLVKLLVITGETLINQHPEHLYATIGNQKVLLIRRQGSGSIYVMRQEQLVDFIKGWLNQSQTEPTGLNA